MKSENRDIIIVSLLILCSRIPFLFSGYGSEEDAYGLILTARNISQSGVYEVSRMPGHPVQEYLLSCIWNFPAWLLNLFTALVSTSGIALFMLALKKLQVKSILASGIALAFVPAVYINSSNIMDYTWAMSLLMGAFLLAVNKRAVAAGLLVGIAVGFRITSLGMALPFAILFINSPIDLNSIRRVILFWISAALISIVIFLPPYLTYGSSFFMYYQYFPEPPMLKNIYKATIGAWGVIGWIAVLLAGTRAAILFFRTGVKHNQKQLLLLCSIIMVMFGYAYWQLPQKSAFVIPAAPFVILSLALLIRPFAMNIFAFAMVASSLLIGINLDDANRGSSRSALSYGFSIAGSKNAIDLLYGPVYADLTKRQNKMRYAKEVSDKILGSGIKTLLIAGWYQNEIEYYLLEKSRSNFKTVYYASKEELTSYQNSGYVIYYLPEQDTYNDLRYKGVFTAALSELFPDSSP